ncbi:MAG: S8 family serine peptidase [Chloroflexi bacterium]|nr:S8 family serine peptidase [Chloroflexota bacterium]
MSNESKISPAFEPFLADVGSNAKREAIVIYRTPSPPAPPPRGRLRELQRRLDYVRERASIQQSVQETIFKSYLEESSSISSRARDFVAAPIGSNALPISTVEVTRETLEALGNQPDVLAVLPNQNIQLIQPKAVDYEELAGQEITDGLTWGLKVLDIPSIWPTTKGKDVSVAVLDTGVHGDHPALNGRVKQFVVIDPLGRRITSQPTFDSGQHGTHVCGTISGGTTPGGVSIGVAPEADLLVAGVLIGNTSVRTLLEGISWALEQGADIISMSLGFPAYDPLFDLVFKQLVDEFDVLPVVAIGNENHGNSSSPGNAPSAFSVGAVELTPGAGLEVAFFSSGASLVFPGEEPNALVTKPDVAAPGVQVYSSVPPEPTLDGTHEYAYMGGTSMATPHVAGVAALLMAAKPAAPVRDIMTVLKETARHPAGAAGRPDNRWGFGMIDPVNALNALG